MTPSDIPTPEELIETIRLNNEEQVRIQTHKIVTLITEKWDGHDTVIVETHALSPILRRVVQDAFTAKGWKLTYFDDQRNGSYWTVTCLNKSAS